MKIDDPKLEYKIVDNELWLRSKTQVMGYLNSSMDSFAEDGWFKTGDLVETIDDGFIKKYWKDNHIFTLSKELLDFQHLNINKYEYNFIVATNHQTNNFDAILGFIPMFQYDSNIETKNIWLAIWKVKKEYAKTGIGLQFFLQLTKIHKTSSVGIVGISDNAMKVCKAFKYRTGNLMNFFIKNENFDTFKISDFKNWEFSYKYTNNTNLILSEISAKDFQNLNIKYNYNPKKTIKYFIERYIKNVFYTYRLFSFTLNKTILGIFVIRIVTVNNRKCMRIIDWISDFPSDSYVQFQKLLVKEQCEYIDFMYHVPDFQKIIAMCFSVVQNYKVVWNNYFVILSKKCGIKFCV